jgi:hypothetical protein
MNNWQSKFTFNTKRYDHYSAVENAKQKIKMGAIKMAEYNLF